MSDFFYRPQDAWAADFIPFYEDGRFHLFYLLDWRNRVEHGEGTPWYRISTADFVQFSEHGEVVPRGTPDEQDLYVFTGSVIRAGGQYRLFYTGHNPHFRRQGKPEQAVMHAVSEDLREWQKLPEDSFSRPKPAMSPTTGAIRSSSGMRKPASTGCCSPPAWKPAPRAGAAAPPSAPRLI